MGAYLDNSATTQVFPSVCQKMLQTMEVDYGNPSSLHQKGVDAESYVREAKEILADSMRVSPREIFFTSGGTESNNLALIGAALANRRQGNHLITTCMEHASVSNPMKFLEELGFRVTYLPIDEYGIVKLDALEEAICRETILVSVMHVNNEVGSVQPVEKIAALIRRKKPNVYFHVDAIQGYGKYIYRPRRQGIDLLSVSGHKIHGPKGAGFLYIRNGVKIHPLILGGEQQNGIRSGTENVPGIAGLGAAAEEIYQDHEERIAWLYRLKKEFVEGIQSLEGTRINGYPDERSAPHIVSVSFFGVRSEVLLHALEEREIYVSAGSACSSNHPMVSNTLKNMGVEKELLHSTLRFSFSIYNTLEEVQETIEALAEILPVLRRYRRG